MTKSSVGLVALAMLVAGIGGANAMTLSAGDANIVELLEQSSDIVVGHVAAVADGIDDRGIPYTEVTLGVSESIRGGISGEYRFRQFGLLKPRLTEDGARKLMPAPPGFPKYASGEDIVLFLRPAARWTGFRMPAGVTQGKFTLGPGRVANEMGNAGLFSNVRLERGLATDNDRRMMAAGGPANPDTFLSFVRRAVQERWAETGRLAHADGRVALAPPQSDPSDAQDPSEAPQPPATSAPTEPLDANANLALPKAGR